MPGTRASAFTVTEMEKIRLNQSAGLKLKIYKSKASDRDAKSSWSEVSGSDSWFQVEFVWRFTAGCQPVKGRVTV